jgi:uncharacterized protein (DUF2461 family)
MAAVVSRHVPDPRKAAWRLRNGRHGTRQEQSMPFTGFTPDTIKFLAALTGERLKRPPRGFDADHACIEDIKLKEFPGVTDLPREVMFSPKLVNEVVKVSKSARPFMKFLCDALAIPY